MRPLAALTLALTFLAAGCYAPPAQDPVSITLQVQKSDPIELDLGTEDAEQEEPMSAPLFIRTPYCLPSIVDTDPADWTTIASHGATETTTLLIEDLRFWYQPTSSAGGLGAGYVQIGILTPGAELIMLQRWDIDALAQYLYADPVRVKLDLMLPAGYALQLKHTVDDITPGVPAGCHVVVQGGELG